MYLRYSKCSRQCSNPVKSVILFNVSCGCLSVVAQETPDDTSKLVNGTKRNLNKKYESNQSWKTWEKFYKVPKRLVYATQCSYLYSTSSRWYYSGAQNELNVFSADISVQHFGRCWDFYLKPIQTPPSTISLAHINTHTQGGAFLCAQQNRTVNHKKAAETTTHLVNSIKQMRL